LVFALHVGMVLYHPWVMMYFLGLHPREYIVNPRMVQMQYPLQSHGTTITWPLA